MATSPDQGGSGRNGGELTFREGPKHVPRTRHGPTWGGSFTDSSGSAVGAATFPLSPSPLDNRQLPAGSESRAELHCQLGKPNDMPRDEGAMAVCRLPIPIWLILPSTPVSLSSRDSVTLGESCALHSSSLPPFSVPPIPID